MVEIQPGLFDSIVTIFKYISVVLIVLWLVHLFEVYRFVDNHSEIVSLLPDGNIYRPFSICFAVDFAILLLITVGYLMKRELNNCQYLTDTENFVYLMTTIALLVCSLGYLTCSLLFHQWCSAFLSEFSQKIGNELADYPCGAMKPLIDKIQMKYGCCGVESHEDWFLSKWAGKRCCSSDSLQCSSTDQYGISANNQDTSDDVPFSCCSDAIGIPCIHHQLRQDSHYVVFSQPNSTIWNSGCVAKFDEIYLADLKSLANLSIFIAVSSILMTLADKTIQATDNSFSKNGKLCLGLFASGTIDGQQPHQESPLVKTDVTNSDKSRKSDSKIARSISKTNITCGCVVADYCSKTSSRESNSRIMPDFKLLSSRNSQDELVRRSSRNLPSRASWSSSGRKRKSSICGESSEKRIKELSR